jgi:hypothetical protein
MKNSCDSVEVEQSSRTKKSRYSSCVDMSNSCNVSNEMISDDTSDDINVMEFPCYLSLSNQTVKHGPSTTENIRSVSNKLTNALTKIQMLDVKFSPNGALWVCNYYVNEPFNKPYSFTMNLWEREGDLLIETQSSDWPYDFESFYKSLLLQII